LLLALLTGCSSAPRVTIPADWNYEKDAIKLHVKADPQLNLFHKSPHTLVLCIYHLRDPISFNQLQDEKEGLQKLLECGRFDPAVVHARRLVIQPGQELSESLDRPEGVKFVNVAAGYYQMQKQRVIRSFPVTLALEPRGDAWELVEQRLNIDLYLGPQEIQKVIEAQQGEQKSQKN